MIISIFDYSLLLCCFDFAFVQHIDEQKQTLLLNLHFYFLLSPSLSLSLVCSRANNTLKNALFIYICTQQQQQYTFLIGNGKKQQQTRNCERAPISNRTIFNYIYKYIRRIRKHKTKQNIILLLTIISCERKSNIKNKMK